MRKKLAALFATTLTVGGGGALYGADQRANPYDDKGTHYELPITSDIPQGEKVLIAKDRAEMTLTGWHGEYEIKITPQIPVAPGTFGATDRPFTVEADRPLLSKKMEYRSGDVTAFIEPKEGTENEFDIDFTLDTKPETNVFEYKIEGAEEFDFFYQPALTEEEIAEGAERPENVVGSYAVYHKEKANHRIGSTNYATGKAFHIYRPKAIDANGAEVWAELSYSEGVLAVTVPEKWLETAAYPVVVDPTFGYDSIGATNSTLGTGTIRLTGPFAPASSGTVVQIQMYWTEAAATCSTAFGIFRGSIYASSTLALVGDTGSEAPCVPGSSQWIDGIMPSNSVASGTDYDVGVWLGGSFWGARYDSLSSVSLYRQVSTYASTGNSSDPFVVATTITGVNYSIYATYCDPSQDCGPITNTYTAPGYTTWTAPTGVSSADVACWGGGGGADFISTSGGGGGGGGAFASSTVAVSAGTQYTLFIGSGGTGGTSPTAGTDSTFATTTVVADGGTQGSGTGNGTGGTTANSTGDVEFAGGDAGDGSTTGDVGGGGGGAAGPHGAGGVGANGSASGGGGGGGGDGGSNGSGATGGASTDGGAGGNGGAIAINPGLAGGSAAHGGGGGGGGSNSTGADGGFPAAGGGGGETGAGDGGGGQCTITYTIAAGGSVAPDDGIIFFE